MKKLMMIVAMASMISASMTSAATLCSGSSAGVSVDTMPSPRIAAASEVIRYSSAWNSTASGATAEVAVNGDVVSSVTGSGVYTWTPTRNGTYTLTHIVNVGGEQVGETLTATFLVKGLNPENPVITPESGTIIEDSLSVVMTCPSEGATIYYTLDGSEPTMDSAVYTRKFRVTEKTTVKARAFYENGEGSDTVVAEYALGQCPDPVIDAVESFSGSKTVVSILCATEGALIRYTLDGSEPNSHSTRYAGPFEVRTTTVVKAKVLSDIYFDSATVTKPITKIWQIGDSLGMPDHPFTTDGDADWVDDGGSAMKSGAITHEEESVLRSEFIGKGTLSFELKTSCEEDDPEWMEYDRCEVWINDSLVMKRDGIHDWTEFSFDLGARTNKVEWIYVKDDVESAGDDCIWVRNVSWAPAATATSTTPVPVPYVWLDRYGLGGTIEFYETAAKSTAANGVNAVWQCYVAGLDPTNELSFLRALISVTDGVPEVSWEPKLPQEEEALRVYTIHGKTELTDSWAVPADMAAHRFFKVSVELK